jgi:hypothetical protein
MVCFMGFHQMTDSHGQQMLQVARPCRLQLTYQIVDVHVLLLLPCLQSIARHITPQQGRQDVGLYSSIRARDDERTVTRGDIH